MFYILFRADGGIILHQLFKQGMKKFGEFIER